jgi:mannose-6-phosphate isomerase-like protein (cupin superfamily)
VGTDMGDAVIHGPGAGERHGAGGDSVIVIKAAGSDTAGSFFLSETTIDPGFPGPPPHRHEKLHDMFYVLDGALTMRVADQIRQFEAGTFVCVPPGVTHTFSNTSERPVRFLNFNTPAGWEGYMRELGEAAKTGPLTAAVIGRIASRYDFQVLPSSDAVS